jgi:hypothetical protein
VLQQIVIATQRVEAGQTEVQFTLDPATLAPKFATVSVRVLDADTQAPLAGARVSLSTRNGMNSGQPTGDDGRAVVEKVPPGVMRLSVLAKDHEQCSREIAIEPGAQLALGDIALGPVVPLRGRVLGDAEARKGARIVWTELKWRAAATPFTTNREAALETDGTFTLDGVGRGRIVVQATTRDGRLAQAIVDNPTPKPVELLLQPAAKLLVARPTDPTRGLVLMLFDAQRVPIACRALELIGRETAIALLPGTYGFEVHEGERVVQSGSVTLGTEGAALEVR